MSAETQSVIDPNTIASNIARTIGRLNTIRYNMFPPQHTILPADQLWSDKNYQLLRRIDSISLPSHQLAVGIGVSAGMKGGPPYKAIEFGIGEGLFHPLPHLPEETSIVAIEPQTAAVERGIAEGRIPPGLLTSIISLPRPPYPIKDGSIDLAYGISSFHVLPSGDMRKVIGALAQTLKKDGQIVHLQPVGAGSNFLAGLAESDWNNIQHVIMAKYPGLKINFGQLDSNNFFHKFMRAIYQRLDMTPTYFYNKSTDELVLHPTSPIKFGSRINRHLIYNTALALRRASIIKPAELQKEIDDAAGKQLPLIGLVDALAVFATNTERLIKMSPDPKPFTDVVSLLSCVTSFLRNDIFDAFLLTTYEEAGLDASMADFAVQYYDPSVDQSVMSLDGLEWKHRATGLAQGYYSRIRRVIGYKK